VAEDALEGRDAEDARAARIAAAVEEDHPRHVAEPLEQLTGVAVARDPLLMNGEGARGVGASIHGCDDVVFVPELGR
jgi:hypothetical protein